MALGLVALSTPLVLNALFALCVPFVGENDASLLAVLFLVHRNSVHSQDTAEERTMALHSGKNALEPLERVVPSLTVILQA